MKHFWYFLIVLTILFQGQNGWAEQEDGDSEIAFAASFSNETYSIKAEGDDEETDYATQNINLNLSYGYFITAWHEVGAMFLFTSSLYDMGDEDMESYPTLSWAPGVLYRFNIIVSYTVVPFVGVNGGYAGGSGGSEGNKQTRSGYFIGGEVGIKFFISEKTSLFLSYLPLYQGQTVKTETEYKVTEYEYGDYSPDTDTKTETYESDIRYLRHLAMFGISAAF